MFSIWQLYMSFLKLPRGLWYSQQRIHVQTMSIVARNYKFTVYIHKHWHQNSKEGAGISIYIYNIYIMCECVLLASLGELAVLQGLVCMYVCINEEKLQPLTASQKSLGGFVIIVLFPSHIFLFYYINDIYIYIYGEFPVLPRWWIRYYFFIILTLQKIQQKI